MTASDDWIDAMVEAYEESRATWTCPTCDQPGDEPPAVARNREPAEAARAISAGRGKEPPAARSEVARYRDALILSQFVLPGLDRLLRLKLKCPSCRCTRRVGNVFCAGDYCQCSLPEPASELLIRSGERKPITRRR